jgi:hypothetical protein
MAAVIWCAAERPCWLKAMPNRKISLSSNFHQWSGYGNGTRRRKAQLLKVRQTALHRRLIFVEGVVAPV